MTEHWQPDEAMAAFIELDHDRARRRGYPEAVYCEGKTPGQEAITRDATKSPFYAALEEFTACIRQGKKPNCGALEGLQAAVVAIKANDAIRSGARVTFRPEWFQL